MDLHPKKHYRLLLTTIAILIAIIIITRVKFLLNFIIDIISIVIIISKKQHFILGVKGVCVEGDLERRVDTFKNFEILSDI